MYLLLMAIAPAIALIIYFYRKDKYEKEPVSVLATAFLSGVIVAFIAMVVELPFFVVFKGIPVFIVQIFFLSFVMAALIEEGLKFLAFKLIIYKKKEFNEPYDGILYAVMISLGFATIENIGYIVGAFSKGGFSGAVSLSIARALFSVTMHAFAAVIMGYYLGLAKFCDSYRESEYIWKGLGLAVLVHGSFNFFLFTKSWVGVLLALVVLRIVWLKSMQAIKLHTTNPPFRKQ